MKNYSDLIINDEGRECSRCFIFKPWNEYHKAKNGVHGHHSFCKECRKNKVPAQHYQNRIDENGRECARCHQYKTWDHYYNDNKTSTRKSTRCDECIKMARRISTFGITEKEYLALVEKHNGLCAICGNPETFVNPQTNDIQVLGIDHCHTTGKVRGLLCSACNLGLGCAQDSISILESMIQYLKQNANFKPVERRKAKGKRECNIFNWYGIGDKEYNQLLEYQDKCCAICGADSDPCQRMLAIDHCHDTNIIRGLLCSVCNQALGYFRDSIPTIQSAIVYLEKHS